MKYTNKYNLPDVFVRAVVNDKYDSGHSDFTPSSLNNPPRAFVLIEQNKDELEIDVSSRVAAIIGQGAHSVAERAARPNIDICEERLYFEITVDGKVYTIGAQLDLYEPDSGHLYDWKTTKAYAFSRKAGSGKKPDWISQTNIGAEALRRKGHSPKKLYILAMLKDWSQREAGTAGCPEQEVILVDIPMWSSEEVLLWIETRIKAIEAARISLPKCTSADTWGGRRCSQYCDASSVCEQFKAATKTGIME